MIWSWFHIKESEKQGGKSGFGNLLYRINLRKMMVPRVEPDVAAFALVLRFKGSQWTYRKQRGEFPKSSWKS